MLTLAKCSPYSFYSACENRECYGSFQKQISKLFFQMSAKYILFLAKLKGEGKPFLEGTSIDLSSKLSLIHMRVMLTIIRVFINPFLLCLWEKRTPWQLSKQISKLFFQMSVQVYSPLNQSEGESKTFF